MAEPAHVRVVVFEEGDSYVAQCLEHDIAAQAGDIESVLDRLELTIEAELAMRGQQDLRGISPAPAYYRDLWDRKSLKIERVNVSLDRCIPKFDVGFARAA